MKKYNHAYTIAFQLETIHEDTEEDPVPKEQLISALLRRVADVVDGSDADIRECVGAPYDTFIEEPKKKVYPANQPIGNCPDCGGGVYANGVSYHSDTCPCVPL